MTQEQLLNKLADIEWDDFECKLAHDRLPDNVWETVSAFSNTSGGWIVFGVEQKGKRFEVVGVGNGEMLKWEELTGGKVEFKSDLVSSTIVYSLSEQPGEQPSEQPGEQPREQVQRLLNVIREEVVTMCDIQKKLNIASRSLVHTTMLTPAIEQGYVLRAYPDKPNHPKQSYYLSEKGLKNVKLVK